MVGALSQWIRQIIMVVMFAAFVDFLIPENSFLRYVKVFLGLLVMIAIINPLIPLFHNSLSFDDIPIVYENFVDNKSIATMSEIINQNNSQMTIAQYKANVEKYIFQKITDLTSYNIKNVSVKIDEDVSSNNFGKITYVKIALTKSPTDDVNPKGKILIEKIKIGDELSESSNFIEKPNTEFRDIINYLVLTFDIPETNIYISLED
ncbi:stage III sporulation protein AF [Tepidanaerobacter sp. GT38]|uniref:stage III sporulation protein AF n=1 Tax=Tepidanaerobacter sp. GT38 TaxID=2722793 RepID=UPI001F013A1B|nr:stage III sporulation protein AF [Tepidanaerobacter sp. GT38]MCG1012687.1 stage III sporulation protein AF [Tepidanaerobacter sp. GT38]